MTDTVKREDVLALVERRLGEALLGQMHAQTAGDRSALAQWNKVENRLNALTADIADLPPAGDGEVERLRAALHWIADRCPPELFTEQHQPHRDHDAAPDPTREAEEAVIAAVEEYVAWYETQDRIAHHRLQKVIDAGRHLRATHQPKAVKPEEVASCLFKFAGGRFGKFQKVLYLDRWIWIDTSGVAYDFAPSDRIIPIEEPEE